MYNRMKIKIETENANVIGGKIYRAYFEDGMPVYVGALTHEALIERLKQVFGDVEIADKIINGGK